MMTSIDLFVLTLAEVGSIMILWKALNKKQNNFRKYIIIVILISIIIRITDPIKPPWDSIINLIFFIILVKIFLNKKIKDVLVEFSIIGLIVILIELLLMFLYNIFNLNILYSGRFQESSIINLGLIISSTLIYLYVPVKKLFDSIKIQLSKMYFFITSIIVYIIFSEFIWSNFKEFFLGKITVFIIIPIVYVILNIIFVFYNKKIADQRKTIEIFNKYNPIINNIVDDVKRRQHDFKNHLNTIYGIIEVTNEEDLKKELKNYIGVLNNSFKDIDLLFNVKNKVICGIIYSKIFLFKSSNIDFSYEIEDDLLKLPVKEYELSEILNNMLENAFEALESSITAYKEVCLKIWKEAEKVIIEVKNTGEMIDDENVTKIFQKGFTTKREAGHGYGLYNIKKIVESYNGEIQLSFENKYIIIKILL